MAAWSSGIVSTCAEMSGHEVESRQSTYLQRSRVEKRIMLSIMFFYLLCEIHKVIAF
jgi:hypothetical protein